MAEIVNFDEIENKLGPISFHDGEVVCITIDNSDILTRFKLTSFGKNSGSTKLFITLRWKNYISMNLSLRNSHDINNLDFVDSNGSVSGIIDTFSGKACAIVARSCEVEDFSIEEASGNLDYDEGWLDLVVGGWPK
jgi:hypothetical protein